jgi:hypothetical protein
MESFPVELHAMQTNRFRSTVALISVAALLAANLGVPLIFGDVYPFTSAPMFRDSPREFCNYRVIAPDGRELAAEDWLVQRIYDGNPVGYGVGVRPPAVIESEFGVIHDETHVRRHVERQFGRSGNDRYEFVDVEQEVIGAIDSQHVGVVRTNRWRVDRP